jgi:hypothetical protein
MRRHPVRRLDETSEGMGRVGDYSVMKAVEFQASGVQPIWWRARPRVRRPKVEATNIVPKTIASFAKLCAGFPGVHILLQGSR